MYLYIHMHINVHVCIHIYVCVYIFIHICIHVQICWINMSRCAILHMFKQICVHIYIHTYVCREKEWKIGREIDKMRERERDRKIALRNTASFCLS